MLAALGLFWKKVGYKSNKSISQSIKVLRLALSIHPSFCAKQPQYHSLYLCAYNFKDTRAEASMALYHDRIQDNSGANLLSYAMGSQRVRHNGTTKQQQMHRFLKTPGPLWTVSPLNWHCGPWQGCFQLYNHYTLYQRFMAPFPHFNLYRTQAPHHPTCLLLQLFFSHLFSWSFYC